MSRNGEWSTEDDTERVERAVAALDAFYDERRFEPCEHEASNIPYAGMCPTCKVLVVLAAAGPSPDLDRAHAEGREQGLREAEQAVRAQTLAEWLPHFDRWRKRAEDRLAQHDPNDGPANLCMTCFSQEPCWKRDEALEDLATLAALSSGTPTDEETRPYDVMPSGAPPAGGSIRHRTRDRYSTPDPS